MAREKLCLPLATPSSHGAVAFLLVTANGSSTSQKRQGCTFKVQNWPHREPIMAATPHRFIVHGTTDSHLLAAQFQVQGTVGHLQVIYETEAIEISLVGVPLPAGVHPITTLTGLAQDRGRFRL